MSGKVKMRCARCGKAFKSAGAKHTLCPECESKERVARAAGKGISPKPAVTPTRTQHPTIVGPGAGILVPDLAPPKLPSPNPSQGETHPPVERQHSRDIREVRDTRAVPATQPVQHAVAEKLDHTPSLRNTPKSANRERPPKAASSQAPAFVLSDDLRARIEARYQELAQPVEFDGIRTQIATELSIPKPVVKRTVAELRKRLQLPSWWELQAYTGTADDLERIRSAYLPCLPLPEVGIHKHLAAQLALDPGLVYQAVRRIRAEMHLPQYNPPDAHGAPPPVSTGVAGSTRAE